MIYWNELRVILLTHSLPEHLMTTYLTFSLPDLVKGYFINLFMARVPDDQLFNPLPTKNIIRIRVVSLTHLWPMKIIHFTFCSPGYVKGFQINPFMARAPDDHIFDHLPTTHTREVVQLTHSWPVHLSAVCLTLCHPGSVRGYSINQRMARAPCD